MAQLCSDLSLTATILAGGRSLRMRRPKCLVEIKGRKLIEILAQRIRALFPRVLISTNFPEDYFYLGLPLIGDIYKFKGPMAGIHGAIKNSESDVFAFACDMPFVKEEVIKFLAQVHASSQANATVGKIGDRIYPLPGIYSRRICNYLESLLQEDKLSMTKLLTEVGALVVDLANLDREGLSFININTGEELEKILEGRLECLDLAHRSC